MRLQKFQSSPAPGDRCKVCFGLLTGLRTVSILTGPWGPVQVTSIGGYFDARGFNPHRPLGTGARDGHCAARKPQGLFQSSPAPEDRCK